MRLAAHELVTLLDRQHALDELRKNRHERLQRLMRQFIADRADDRARHAAHHVRAIAAPADFPEHGGFLFLRKVRFENDYHNLDAVVLRAQKNRRSDLRQIGVGGLNSAASTSPPPW